MSDGVERGILALRCALPSGWETSILDGSGNGPYGLLHLLQLRLALRFNKSVLDPETAQRDALTRIIASVQGTEFGSKAGLRPNLSYKEFVQAVPVRQSADIEPDLKRMADGAVGVLTNHPIQSFVKTSGTTGAAKLLPVTRPWSRVVAEAQMLWTMGMVKEQEAVAWGKALVTLGEAVEGVTAGGVSYGSNTGRMGGRQPWYVRARWAVPQAVAGIEDPEVRYYCMLRLALNAPVTSWTTANPSMILSMCRRFKEWETALSEDIEAGTLDRGPASQLGSDVRRLLGKRIKKRSLPRNWDLLSFWDLACVNCWKGGPAHFFSRRIPAALGASVPVRDVGLTASEGFFAIPLHSSWNGGVAWVGGHLLELAPASGGEVIPIYEAELGAEYRLIISTTAGLIRYDMNDWVRVVGWYGQTPVLQFVGKGEDVSSVVGEKLTVEQLSLAFERIFDGMDVQGAAMAVEMNEVPGYILCVEGEVQPQVSLALDEALCGLNVEYRSKRESCRLNAPRLEVVPSGAFRRMHLEASAHGAADGQVKDRLFLDERRCVRLLQGWRLQ